MSELPVAPPILPAPSLDARTTSESLRARILTALASTLAVVLGAVLAIVWLVMTSVKPGAHGAIYLRFSSTDTVIYALLVVAVIIGLVTPLTAFAVVVRTARMGIEPRRTFGPASAIVLALEVACIAAVIVAAIATAPPAWLPVVIIAIFVVLSGAAVFVAPRLQKVAAPQSGTAELRPWNPTSVASGKWFWWVVAAIAVVPGVGLMLALQPWDAASARDGAVHVVLGYVLGFNLSFICAALACLVRSIVLTSRLRMRDVGGRGPRGGLGIAVYFRNRPDLSDTEREIVRRSALVLAISLPWQIGFAAFFAVGELGNVLAMLQNPETDPTPAAIIIAAICLIALLIVVLSVVLAGARRFLRLNGMPTIGA